MMLRKRVPFCPVLPYARGIQPPPIVAHTINSTRVKVRDKPVASRLPPAVTDRGQIIGAGETVAALDDLD